MVHCGVHGDAKKICLEQNAFNGKFSQTDYTGNQLTCCHVDLPNAGAECKQLCTALNVKQIIDEIKADELKYSEHPGEYDCFYFSVFSLSHFFSW